jgi:hypothetical protein
MEQNPIKQVDLGKSLAGIRRDRTSGLMRGSPEVWIELDKNSFS